MPKSTVDFPWFKSYSEGIPHEINPDAYASLLDLFEESVGKYPDRIAYSNMGKSLTYSELNAHATAFASYLQLVGLKKGDRIAIQAPNVLQFPVVLFGAIRAGLTVVNTNPLYTPREMLHQFNDSGAKAIFILANFAHHLQAILPQTKIEHVIVSRMGDMLGALKGFLVNFVVKHVKKMVPEYEIPGAVAFNDALKIGAGAVYKRPSLGGDDIAFIQYTGGTTGVSKGAMLSHRNMVANVEGIDVWFQSKMKHAKIDGPMLLVAALPLYHVFALAVNGLACLKWGGTNLLITNPRDLPGFIKELKKVRPVIFPGLNTLFNGLMNQPEFKTLDFSQLQISIAGGMALQKVVGERWEQLTGCPLVEGYGLSETSPVLSVNPLDGTHRQGTIGLPFPSTEMRIRTEEETWAPLGERGEICARGPQVMVGYYNRPDETAKVIFEDETGRWFRTGDIGVEEPGGFFKIVDRKKDMILVSGFNVYPNEIEDVVSRIEGVLEVACIGVADEKTSEAVKLFVVKKDPGLTEDVIKAYCKENLTAYKRPKYVEFRDELPKSNVGKILRKNLREEELKK
jgi:long-chain acyl-CoA synthetase